MELRPTPVSSFSNLVRLVTACLVILPVFIAACTMPAMASNITEYIGYDDGAPITGPFPASSAAQSMFLNAAGGIARTGTITFETLPVGFQSTFSPAAGVTVVVNAPNLGSGLSGINNFTLGNTNGFNITPNGKQWFGFPEGSATFTFAGDTQSFGFWITGVQASMLSSLTVSFNDGQAQKLDLPINNDGGTAFFGFIDPGFPISSVTITGVGADHWGIDDVTYNLPAQLAIPEPSSLLLLCAGAATMSGLLRQNIPK